MELLESIAFIDSNEIKTEVSKLKKILQKDNFKNFTQEKYDSLNFDSTIENFRNRLIENHLYGLKKFASQNYIEIDDCELINLLKN